MSIEVIVTIVDEEKRRLTKEFLVYEPFTFTHTDPIIKNFVDETRSEFKGEPDTIKVKALMVLQ
jgi:hypothetical protein